MAADYIVPAGVALVGAGIFLQVYRHAKVDPHAYQVSKHHAVVRDWWRNTMVSERPNEDQNLSTYNNSTSYVQTTGDGLKLPVSDVNRVTGPTFHPGLTQDGTGRYVDARLINRLVKQIATQRPEEYDTRRPKQQARGLPRPGDDDA